LQKYEEVNETSDQEIIIITVRKNFTYSRKLCADVVTAGGLRLIGPTGLT
jgi:hypothetical protein